MIWHRLLFKKNGKIIDSSAITSFRLMESVNDQSELTVGSICSSMLTMSFRTDKTSYIPQYGDQFVLYETDRDGENIEEQHGVYNVEEVTKTTQNTYEMVCYDNVSKLDKIVDPYLKTLHFPIKLMALAKGIAAFCGLTLASPVIPNGDRLVYSFDFTEIKGRDVLHWIGEIAANFVRADDDGNIIFDWYRPAEASVAMSSDTCDDFHANFADGSLTLASTCTDVSVVGDTAILSGDHITGGYDGVSRKEVSGAVIAANDVAPLIHDVECKVERRNLIGIISANANTTVDGDVVTQKVADTASAPYFKAIFYKGGTAVKIVQISTDFGTGEKKLTFEKTPDFDQMLYGLNGSKVDTLCKINLSKLENGTNYTLAFEVTTAGQGSYVWKNNRISIGSSALPFTPYIPDLSAVRVNQFAKNMWHDGDIIANVTGTKTVNMKIVEPVTVSIWPSKDLQTTSRVWRLLVKRQDGTISYVRDRGAGFEEYQRVTASPENPIISLKIRDDEMISGSYSVQIERGDYAYPYGGVFLNYAGGFFTPGKDGIVTGMTSLSPSMTILSDTPGLNISAAYLAGDLNLDIDPKPTYEVQPYYLNSFKPKEYVCKPIRAVAIKKSENDIGIHYPGPDRGNEYSVIGNPLLMTMNDYNRTGVAASIYQQMKGLQFSPLTVSLPTNFKIRCGNTVGVYDSKGNRYQSLVMKKSQDGMKDTVECSGSESRDSSVVRSNQSYRSLTGKYLDLKVSIDGIDAEIGNLGKSVTEIKADSESIKASIKSVEGDITSITADVKGITARVENAEGSISTMNTEIGKISASVSDKLSKTDGTTASFGWTLTSTKWSLSSSGSEVFAVDKDGAKIVGNIDAKSGTIGGFTINADSISSGGEDWFTPVDRGVYIGPLGIRIGKNFQLGANGNIYANDVTLNGYIEAKSGKIGGFTINTDSISSGGEGWDKPVDNGVYLGPLGLRIGQNLQITNAGDLYANTGTFAGAVRAGSVMYGKNGFGYDWGSFNGAGLTGGSVTTVSTSSGINTSLGYADLANNFMAGSYTATHVHSTYITATTAIYVPNGLGQTKKVTPKEVTINGFVYNILTI